MKFRLYILPLFFIGVLFSACERDTHLAEDKDGGDVVNIEPEAAPYDLQVPRQFSDFIRNPDNPLTEEGVELGRRLFYDPILSKGNQQSCASCHIQEDGFSDPRRFSPGVEGIEGDRTSMALVNLAWRRNFFWDGRAESLEEQAFDPVTNPIEMNTTWPEVEEKLNGHEEYPHLFQRAFGTDRIDSNLVVMAIAQFERTMVSSNSKFDRYLLNETELTPLEQEGFDLFNSEDADCFHCHNGAFMTDNTFRNNGLQFPIEDEGRYEHTGNERDRGKFIVPTLRNVEVSGPYMHDGRFATLEEVIDFYNEGVNQNSPNVDPVMLKVNREGGNLNLTDHQKEALIAFLKTMTDDRFLNDERFSNPFK